MNLKYRKTIIAGNWKMNMTPSQAVALCAELKDLVKSDTVDVVYCVPAIDIVPVVEAVKGTKLEGKLRFTNDNTLGNGFADALRANQVDLLFFVGWSGSALDPYNLMEAYTTADYQYDPAWDTAKEMVAVTIDGVEYTASVLDWTYCMAGEEITITAADGTVSTFAAGTNDGVDEARFAILTTLEDAVLSTYDMIPLVDDSSAALKGMQVQFYSEEYIYGVGRGGIKYMTYNYSDTEWEEFVASQGGSLNYK